MARVHDSCLLHIAHIGFLLALTRYDLLSGFPLPELGWHWRLPNLDRLQSEEPIWVVLCGQFALYRAFGLHLHLKLLRPLQDQSALVLRLALQSANWPSMSRLFGNASDEIGNRSGVQLPWVVKSEAMRLFWSDGASRKDLIPWWRLQQMDLPFAVPSYNRVNSLWLHRPHFEQCWVEAVRTGWKLRRGKGHWG